VLFSNKYLRDFQEKAILILQIVRTVFKLQNASSSKPWNVSEDMTYDKSNFRFSSAGQKGIQRPISR
jgi:hypothetical protein